MALHLALALVVVALAVTVQAADPELTMDFFVPAGMNRSDIMSDYFMSMTLADGVNITAPAKFGAVRITLDNTPVLTGLGVSTAIFKYSPGGINPPHTHPRGTEILYVMEGQNLTVGLIDTTNKLFTADLNQGDVFVFPRGLVHYQMNMGPVDVVAYISFSSANPGTVSLPANLFGSGIPDDVLMTAFKVDNTVIDSLQLPFNVTS